jgi:hypothetical protein
MIRCTDHTARKTTEQELADILRASLIGWTITETGTGPVGGHSDGSTVRWARRYTEGAHRWALVRVYLKADHGAELDPLEYMPPLSAPASPGTAPAG